MNKLTSFLNKTAKSLETLSLRFPVVILALVFLTTVMALMIESVISDSDSVRIIFAGVFFAFLSLFSVFLSERIKTTPTIRRGIQLASIPIAALYFFLFTSPATSLLEAIRLVVISFALFALTLFIPSYKSSVDFGRVALTHFRAFFTSALYSVVLFVGLMAIYFAIDLLLFNLVDQVIAHIANLVFLLFAPTYYLSLLNDVSAPYPKILNILVSYILIPLLAAFTAVLVAYLVKILITQVWPVGQIGPMVLAYSASGFIVYILSVELDNKFAESFKKLFPFALIPLVGLQLYSIYIRIDAFGITESRYYLILFGIFSLISAGYLILSKSKNAKIVVLLAACFAIISIVPPVDAFSVSRMSQTSRVEEILVRNNMLSENKINPNPNLSAKDKSEITSIMDYMTSMGHLRSLEWFPEKYKDSSYLYNEYETIFGFSPYDSPGIDRPAYYSVSMDKTVPLDISGYDLYINLELHSLEEDSTLLSTFTLDDQNLSLYSEPDNEGEPKLVLITAEGSKLLEVTTTEILSELQANTSKSDIMPPEALSASTTNNGISLTLYFENISFEEIDGTLSGIYGSIIVLIAKANV